MVRLTDDVVNSKGMACGALVLSAPVNKDSTIAPWLDVPPTPSPKHNEHGCNG